MKRKLLVGVGWIPFVLSPLTPGVWLVIAVATSCASPAHAQVNSWINTASGTWAWGTAGNWSLAAAPSINQSGLFITNAVNAALVQDRFRIVSLDNTTPVGSMTISNLTVADAGTPFLGTRNFVTLNSAATTFHVYGALVISNGASFSISNSVLLVENPGVLQNNKVIDNGSLLLNTGSLITTDAVSFVIGFLQGFGQMTVQDGIWLNDGAVVGSFGTGTLTFDGGTNVFDGPLVIADGTGSTGTVLIASGQITATNGTTLVGADGVGQMTVSNGTIRLQELELGAPIGPVGTLTIAGGATSVSSNLMIGGFPASAVWITGGQLAIGGMAQIGGNGLGLMTVSNGTVSVNGFVVANASAFQPSTNTLVMAGGTLSVYSNMLVGPSIFCPTSSEVAASVTMTGGSLYITNAAHDAYLYIPYGNFMQSGGILVVDQLIVADACGHFAHSGGTLSIMSTNLGDPNFSAAGDGIPNGWKQQYGFDVFDPNLANEDPDGDGQNNLAEYLSGTNPTNRTSALRLASVTIQGDDIRIRWTTARGHTNALQVSDGTASGSYTDDFYDLVWILSGGSGDITDQFLDFGGATNQPARFYRVRLVP